MTAVARTRSAPDYVLLNGVDEPPPPVARTFRTGPLSVVLDGVDLRYVRLGDVEVVRRLYAAVRDRDWNTIFGTPSEIEFDDRGDSFDVRFSVRHVSHDIDFTWKGTIAGDTDGRISYAFAGTGQRASSTTASASVSCTLSARR